MFGIKTAISLFNVRYKWRKLNPHNSTRIGKYPVGLNNLSVGPYSYGSINISTSSADPILEIGAFCSIADDVIFITENGHNLNTFSSFPFKVKVIKTCKREAVTKGGIILGDDVWIGYGAIVLDGVKIGRGGVVAAGAVVANDVEPYTIVGGVPAKPIKKRFGQKVIDRLLEVDYTNVDKSFVESHLEQLYRPLDENVLRGLLDESGDGHEL